MYVNLYPGKHLQATKRSLLLMGLFLFFGGGYALLREFLWIGSFREGWALASGALMLFGLISIAYGTERFHFKDVYFSMTPQRIKYRLALFGAEKVVEWQQIQELQISSHQINFKLKGGDVAKMRLSTIQSPQLARHVSRSIHLAALEQGVMVNGIKPSPSEPALQV